MAYHPTDMIGAADITDVSTTQKHILGTRIVAVDPVYGEGEFIYLKGVASTVAGSAVTYLPDGTTTLTVAASRGPMAIAMGACDATTKFGWYAVVGNVTCKVAAGIVVGNRPVVTAVGGQLDDTAAANVMVSGAVFSSVDSGGFASIVLNDPSIGDSNL